jgi:hypothetical protein
MSWQSLQGQPFLGFESCSEHAQLAKIWLCQSLKCSHPVKKRVPAGDDGTNAELNSVSNRGYCFTNDAELQKRSSVACTNRSLSAQLCRGLISST